MTATVTRGTATSPNVPTGAPTILSAAHAARVVEVGPEEAAKPLPSFTSYFTRSPADG